MNQPIQQSNLPINGVGENGVVSGGMQSADTSMQLNYGYYYPYGMPMMSPPMQMSNTSYMNSMASPMFMNQLAQFMSMMGNGVNTQGMQYQTNLSSFPNPLNSTNPTYPSYSPVQTTSNSPASSHLSSSQGQSQVINPLSFEPVNLSHS